MLIRNTKSGAMLLCLLVLLPACATKPPEVIRVPFETTIVEKVRIPAELLEPCREPDLDAVETTGDLERVAGEALASLVACNADKAAAREWQSE